MKIQALHIRNYRTLEQVSLYFPTFYCAISGQNDSGKSNVFRVLRGLFRYQPVPYIVFGHDDESRLSVKEDYPRWLAKEASHKSIEIKAELHIFKQSDEGLHQFLVDYLGLKDNKDPLPVNITLTVSEDNPGGVVAAVINGNEAESQLKAQEVLKKLQSSSSVLFHYSTGPDTFPYFAYRRTGLLEVSAEERGKLEAAKTKVNAALTGIARHHQKDIGELLGRLQEKHKIGFSISQFDPNDFPYSVTLGENDIPIESWGSGTQNRTQILMTLKFSTPIGPRRIWPPAPRTCRRISCSGYSGNTQSVHA